MKVLVLILTTEGGCYSDYIRQWQRYMNTDSRFECYFYKSNCFQQEMYELSGNMLSLKLPENPGMIFEKTVTALEYFKDRLHEFDFILRSNLSSFFIFDNYAAYLETLPRGAPLLEGACIWAHSYHYPSGCGYSFTPEAAEIIMRSRQNQYIMDDVTIGKVCKDNNITFKHRQFYEMREPLENSFAYVEAHPEVFHLRIRTMNRSRDTEVYKEVVDYFLAKKSGCTL